MANVPYEGNTFVWFVPTIADLAAPTVEEIEAGVFLSPYITKDGFDPGSKVNTIPTASIDTTFDSVIGGSWGQDLKLTLKLDDQDNLAWETLPRKTVGFFAHRPMGEAALAAGDIVDLYPVQTLQRERQKSAANAMQIFMSEVAVTSEPKFDVVVAA